MVRNELKASCRSSCVDVISSSEVGTVKSDLDHALPHLDNCQESWLLANVCRHDNYA